jgi:DNA polymerase elongation subunit (family B)
MSFYTSVIRYGSNLLIREVIDGQRQKRRLKYQPTLFISQSANDKSEFKTLQGKPLVPRKFETMADASDFVDTYAETKQKHLVYGLTNYAYAWISENYSEQIEFDPSEILIFTIDIEVACENGFPDPQNATEEMLSITVKNHQSKQIVVFGLYDYETKQDNVLYLHCKDEKDLLEQFISFWQQFHPDIVTGWNSEFFDIPYICNRILRVLDEKQLNKLSPWGIVKSKKLFRMGKNYTLFDIFGVTNLDFLDLYRKFTYTNQESYKLDHIAFVELGERKDDNPYETFREWYTNDYQSFIDYNIQDVEIVDKLEDKMKLIELALTMAYEAKVNYQDSMTSVKYWDILIYNYLLKKKIIIPQKMHSSEKTEAYEGAYVKEPQVGYHKWVMSFDLNSLYPHLIMQYNLSTETLLNNHDKNLSVDKFLKGEIQITDELQKMNLTVAPNGTFYNKNFQGFLPEIMQELYNDRVIYKKKMLEAKQNYEDTKNPKFLKDISRYDNIQMAKKISLNSAYGAIGNQYFRFYDLRIAEAITTSGQLSIRWIENKVNGYLNSVLKTDNRDYVIASDTDSIYIRFDELVDSVFKNQDDTIKIVNFLDKIAKEKIEPFIDKSYQELADYMNAYDQKMQMKREVIADKGIWTAKKRYILNAWDVEGVRYKEPTLKIMGIEAVKSSTPSACRVKIKEALKLIMAGDEKVLKEFVEDFRNEFNNLPIEGISFPRSVNGLDKWSDDTRKENQKNPMVNEVYRKGAPMHVKGALMYNHHMIKNKLTNKYPLIQEGDKIKYVELRTPNPLQTPIISFITKFPKEFDVKQYINYDVQFQKSFLDPLQFITEKIDWDISGRATLDDFFS